MNDLITVPVHTSGLVEDYFLIEGVMLSTRCADAYKAMDRASKESVTLWKLRAPLPVNSETVRLFLNRLAAIGDMDPPVCDMLTYGVDPKGVGFAAFPVLLGNSLADRSSDRLGNERTFTAALRKIEILHRAGVVCGDICGTSFWIDRFGETMLVGVLGSYDGPPGSEQSVPPAETLHFVAHEQHLGASVTPATDVFALGVLGYFLLTGTYPFGREPPLPEQLEDLSTVKKPTQFGAHVAGWADEVLLRCLEPNPTKRYANALELHKALNEARQRAGEQHVPVNVKSQVKASPGGAINVPLHLGPKAKVEEPEPEVTPEQSNSKRLRVAIVVFLLLAVAGGVVLTRSGAKPAPSDDRLQNELRQHFDAVDDVKTREGISEIANPNADIAQKQQKIEEMANSDDPLAHEFLVKIAVDAPTEVERDFAVKAILSRAARLGLRRSAEQVRQWLRANTQSDVPTRGSLLRALDTTLPESEHEKILKQAYPNHPQILLRLAAALALDTKKTAEYQTVLGQFLVDQTGDDSFSGRSTPALILASAELATVFAQEALSLADQLRNEDILWLLTLVAARGDPSVRELATLAAERKVLSPLRTVFIEPVMKRENLPRPVIDALIQASAGVLKKEHVTALGRWIDAEGEAVMFAVCADSYTEEVLLEAFDLLSGKSLTNQDARPLVEWVRREHWSERQKFANAIGTFGMVSRVTTADIERMVDTFSPYFSNDEVLDPLLKSADPQISKIMLQKYPNRIGLSVLIKLLGAADRETRLAAVRLIAHWGNNVGVITVAIENYERERDPEIRKLYEEKFWTIGERAKQRRETEGAGQ